MRACRWSHLILLGGLLGACGPSERGLFSWCSEGDAGAPPAGVSPTYFADVKPVIDSKCVRCHEPGGIGPFSLQSYDEVFANRAAVGAAVAGGVMPPWLAADCCAGYRSDWSLTGEERQLVGAWMAAGAPAGDPASPPARPTVRVGGLSRVDLTVKMPEPYTVAPRPGTTDDTRCFLVDWPLDREVFVTGANVLPGNRSIVHHLVLGVVADDRLAEARARDDKDSRLGFDCSGGTGAMRMTAVLGGGLAASEPPEGVGIRVPPGAKLLLNIHYSTAHAAPGATLVDQTSVQFKLSDSGRGLKGIIVANPAWLVGDAMRVRAGDPDAVFYYRYRPTVFTRGRQVKIYAAHPHMHYFGSQFLLGILRADGTQTCLLAIPRWTFGWEQPYWLEEPVVLGPEDKVYVECHFDNSEANQPVIDGVRSRPRDFAWGGNNQDMCVGFLAYSEE